MKWGEGMTKYLFKRILSMIVALLMISLITFVLVKRAPGNYLESQRYINQNLSDVNISPEMKLEWEKAYDLDKPEWYQYLKFMSRAVTFDFGPSFKFPSRNIQDLIAQSLPISMTLAFGAIVLALFIGIPIGIFAAVKKNTMIDRLAVFLSMIGASIPNYVIAVFLMLIMGVYLHIFPTVGWGKPIHYVLPTLALAVAPIGTITRYMRSSLIETLEKEYIKVAIAKGGGFKDVVLKHALKNSLIPLITVIGPQFTGLIVGTVFIEAVFVIPGFGNFFTGGATSRDYPMVMATTLVYAFLTMSMNLIVDLVYGFLDPRIRKNSMVEGR